MNSKHYFLQTTHKCIFPISKDNFGSVVIFSPGVELFHLDHNLLIQVFICMTKKSKTDIIKLVVYSYSIQNVWQHIVLVDLISTVNGKYIWMHLKKVKRWLKDIDQMHKLFILIKLIKREL